MRPRRRKLWLAWAVPAGLALVAILGLLAAGSRDGVVRTASADVPNQFPMPALRRGSGACEGPLTSHGPARSVGFWGAAASPLAQLTVDVRDATTHAIVASASLAPRSVETDWVAHLNRQVPAGVPLQICVTDEAGSFSLAGGTASAPGLVATGMPRTEFFSLALLDDGDHSFLASLPTAFARASLWRPSWVGSWTFWLLAAAVLATFGIGVVAVVSAAADDDTPPPPSGPQEPDDPASPPPDERSETRQDRAQPVS